MSSKDRISSKTDSKLWLEVLSEDLFFCTIYTICVWWISKKKKNPSREFSVCMEQFAGRGLAEPYPYKATSAKPEAACAQYVYFFICMIHNHLKSQNSKHWHIKQAKHGQIHNCRHWKQPDKVKDMVPQEFRINTGTGNEAQEHYIHKQGFSGTWKKTGSIYTHHDYEVNKTQVQMIMSKRRLGEAGARTDQSDTFTLYFLKFPQFCLFCFCKPAQWISNEAIKMWLKCRLSDLIPGD